MTNDAFAPLRAPRLRAAQSPQRHGRRFARHRPGAGEALQGRWSLDAQLLAGAPAMGPRLRAQAELMLERYGIVTRETVLAEGVPGGFATLYGELGNLELLGTARRGYFVAGLGGAQFALPGAIERLRAFQHDEGRYLLLAVTDPANPYGASLPWPVKARSGRPGVRRASSTACRRSTSKAAVGLVTPAFHDGSWRRRPSRPSASSSSPTAACAVWPSSGSTKSSLRSTFRRLCIPRPRMVRYA